MLTTAPRGTRDILPEEVERWHYLEDVIRAHCRLYGYGEIRLPLFEHTELFQRGVGETTDIVEKEMYTFTDRGGRSLTLRPEATASTVRAYLEHNLSAGPQPVKFYYLGPMFRYDRPQAGRYRQFHQFGVEAIGSAEPTVDAEVIILALDFYTKLGLTNLTVELNSIGCPVCRREYRRALTDYLKAHRAELCESCLGRLERNPLRVLDCKEEKCRAVTRRAPGFGEYLCSECAGHFEKVQGCLKAVGASYVLNPALVRGLDYYTRTVFEITWAGLGAQTALCGGGRYDGLVEECGGPPTPGVGFAMGLERLLLALEQAGIELPGRHGPEVFVAAVLPEDDLAAFRLLTELRRAGIPSDKDYLKRSLKAQLKQANRLGVKHTIIVGGEEAARGNVVLRD
ncbi:MAG: histidyl-tRNA synthetase, partial [Bacillota bacterium]|nr:histidyl-tRNA synthetase [Bacillota bacterium]